MKTTVLRLEKSAAKPDFGHLRDDCEIAFDNIKHR